MGERQECSQTWVIPNHTEGFRIEEYMISASYSDISTYYYSYDLRPAEILLKVRFKIKGK
ncbi:hypothetical protein FACS1894155_08730 [Bacteroidia bacterium]|nr:hypothetical protein FACS1894155_08730 [Bacteroidia bacterium]